MKGYPITIKNACLAKKQDQDKANEKHKTRKNSKYYNNKKK